MSERYEHLQKALCHELELLDKKYTAGEEMSAQDLQRADLLYHTLKSAATYHAMKDAEEYGEERYRHPYSHRRHQYAERYMPGEGYSGGYPMDYIDPYYRNRY